MWSDLPKSIKSNLTERLSNPVIGTFAVSWIIVNWKFVYFLVFSEMAVECRIEYVQTYVDINRIFTYPFFFTLLYLLVFPWGYFLIERLQSNVILKRTELKQEHELRILNGKLKIELAKREFDSVYVDRDASETKDRNLKLMRRLEQIELLAGQIQEFVESYDYNSSDMIEYESKCEELRLLKADLRKYRELKSAVEFFLAGTKKYLENWQKDSLKIESEQRYDDLIIEIEKMQKGA